MGFRYVGPEVLEIHDEVLFTGNGDIVKWRNKLRNELRVKGKAAAPVNRRSAKSKSPKTAGGVTPRGHLRANVDAVNFRAGRKVIGVDLVSGAAYSTYVINGTRDTFARNKGKFGKARFILPASRVGAANTMGASPKMGSYPRRRVAKITGQEPNNFLERAYRNVALNHESLQGRPAGFRKF